MLRINLLTTEPEGQDAQRKVRKEINQNLLQCVTAMGPIVRNLTTLINFNEWTPLGIENVGKVLFTNNDCTQRA